MKILAIESSCDETACAILEGKTENFDSTPVILSNVVVSQIDIFAEYGGVIPEVAARSHLEAILPVIHKALKDANCTRSDVDAIAVTYAPGLLGSLLIGTMTARLLSILWQKPLYAVHHLKSHIYANWLEKSSASEPSSSANEPNKLPEFPLLALVVSGGHTQIIQMNQHNHFEIIGTTRDDAVGECFDKVAKILGLPYPGGPSIAKCAASLEDNSDDLDSSNCAQSSKITESSKNLSNSKMLGSSKRPSGLKQEQNYADKNNSYHLPIPQVEGLDFSFSGLKTAVLRAVQKLLGLPITTPSFELAEKLSDEQRANFAASFQKTAVEILLKKLENALELYPETKSVVIAGGVSANQVLREQAEEFGRQQSVKVYYPEIKFAGDNAAMVGAAVFYEIMQGVLPVDPYNLDILPRTPIS